MEESVTKKSVPSRSDEELQTIARDIVAGRIFTSAHIQPDQMRQSVGLVFMPLLMGGLVDVELSTLGMAFEYYDKAGPRNVNGYPTFMSCRLLNFEDANRVLAACEAMEKATAAVKV